MPFIKINNDDSKPMLEELSCDEFYDFFLYLERELGWKEVRYYPTVLSHIVAICKSGDIDITKQFNRVAAEITGTAVPFYHLHDVVCFCRVDFHHNDDGFVRPYIYPLRDDDVKRLKRCLGWF